MKRFAFNLNRPSLLSRSVLALGAMWLTGCAEPQSLITEPETQAAPSYDLWQGDPVVVQGFNDSRSLIGHISGQSFSFVVGPPYGLARSMLSTTFPNLEFRSGVPEVTPAAVSGTDVFVISPVRTELTEDEVCVLETFVNNGGALLEVRNLNARPRLLGTVPGPTSSQGFVDFHQLAFINTYSSYAAPDRIFTGFSYSFSEIGEATSAYRSDAGPTVLELWPGRGRDGVAILIGDEELFMEGSFSGERAGHLLSSRYNQRLLLATFDFLASAPGLDPRTDFSACVDELQIAIDVNPGGDPNSINARNSRGVIPVAALSDVAFDATTIDWSTVQFGPGGAKEVHGRGHIEDADGDGDADMVFHFAVGDSGLSCGDTEASLKGKTASGLPFVGSDAVRMIGC